MVNGILHGSYWKFGREYLETWLLLDLLMVLPGAPMDDEPTDPKEWNNYFSAFGARDHVREETNDSAKESNEWGSCYPDLIGLWRRVG